MPWKKLNLLGSGSYGSVYLAAPIKDSDSTAGSVAAVKSASFGLSASLRTEADLLQELRGCPYVIQGLGSDISMEDERMVYNLLLEYASGGSLEKMIHDLNGNMSENLVASFTYMLLRGLSGIHDKNIVHCDLKPANILVFPQSESNVLKISDFGLSKKTWEASNMSRCTPMYAAPETVLCSLNEKAGDIWSLGCIVVEMITGKPLWNFRDLDDLMFQIAHEEPKIPENISKDTKDFLGRCLDKDHNERWSAKKLLDHPFIVKNLKSSRTTETPLEKIKPWISGKGMFSTPVKKVEAAHVYSSCGLPLALSGRAFGRIYY